MKPVAVARQGWETPVAEAREETRAEFPIAQRVAEPDDSLGAARGLIYALLVVVPFWAVVLALVLYVMR
jgi:hypothetical protein